MKEFFVYLLAMLGCACLVGLIFTIMSVIDERCYERGYLDACKDFYQGKIKYELVEHTDGTKTWEKVEKEGNKK